MPIVYAVIMFSILGQLTLYHFLVVRIEALLNEWELLLAKSLLDLY